MTTIDTTAIDGYAQDVLSDRGMSAAERAEHVAAAMYVYVMTELRLPMTTPLPVDEGFADWHEAHLVSKSAHMMNDVYEQSQAAYDALEQLAPEGGSVVTEVISEDYDLAQYEPSGDDDTPTAFEVSVMARLEAERYAATRHDLRVVLPPPRFIASTEGETDGQST